MARRNRAPREARNEEQASMAEQMTEETNVIEQTDATDAIETTDSAPEMTEVERLRAELAARQAEIDSLRKSKPRGGGGGGRPAKVATLDSVKAKQAKTPAKWAGLGIAAQVNERVQVGQDTSEAFDEVLAVLRADAEAILAKRDQYNSLMEAAWGHYKVAAPKGALSRGIKTPGGEIPTEVEHSTDESVEQVAGDSAEYLQSVGS